MDLVQHDLRKYRCDTGAGELAQCPETRALVVVTDVEKLGRIKRQTDYAALIDKLFELALTEVRHRDVTLDYE
jgi:hypothetical protein